MVARILEKHNRATRRRKGLSRAGIAAPTGAQEKYLRKTGGDQAATSGTSFLGLIAVIAALSVEFPVLGLLGLPAIVFLAVAAIFCVATALLIPVAYLLY